jgi:hypothetical protein
MAMRRDNIVKLFIEDFKDEKYRNDIINHWKSICENPEDIIDPDHVDIITPRISIKKKGKIEYVTIKNIKVAEIYLLANDKWIYKMSNYKPPINFDTLKDVVDTVEFVIETLMNGMKEFYDKSPFDSKFEVVKDEVSGKVTGISVKV